MNSTDVANWLKLDARLEPAQLAPGETGWLVIEASVPEGGHIEAHEPPDPFLIPTVLEVVAPDGWSAGPVVYPEPEERRLSWSPVALQVLAGHVLFRVPITATAAAPAGRSTVTAQIRYQACIEGTCLPPAAQGVEVEAVAAAV